MDPRNVSPNIVPPSDSGVAGNLGIRHAAGGNIVLCAEETLLNSLLRDQSNFTNVSISELTKVLAWLNKESPGKTISEQNLLRAGHILDPNGVIYKKAIEQALFIASNASNAHETQPDLSPFLSSDFVTRANKATFSHYSLPRIILEGCQDTLYIISRISDRCNETGLSQKCILARKILNQDVHATPTPEGKTGQTEAQQTMTKNHADFLKAWQNVSHGPQVSLNLMDNPRFAKFMHRSIFKRFTFFISNLITTNRDYVMHGYKENNPNQQDAYKKKNLTLRCLLGPTLGALGFVYWNMPGSVASNLGAVAIVCTSFIPIGGISLLTANKMLNRKRQNVREDQGSRRKAMIEASTYAISLTLSTIAFTGLRYAMFKHDMSFGECLAGALNSSWHIMLPQICLGFLWGFTPRYNSAKN